MMMTIDEAKIKMEELVYYAETKGWDDEDIEAINMAIKALEQQSQPKMGKWLIKNVGDSEHAICSICGDDSYLSPEWDALELYKYCSNCGAKMQEVEE